MGEPGLTKYAEGDIAKLGNQVKIEALPDGEAARAQAVLDILGALKAENAALKAEVETVKSQGVVVAGVAGDGAAAADAADGGLKDGPDVGGEPEADFGLGGDAFGGDTW